MKWIIHKNFKSFSNQTVTYNCEQEKENFLFSTHHLKQEPHRRRNLSICPWLTFQDLLNEILSPYVYNKLDEILPVSEKLLPSRKGKERKRKKKQNWIDDDRCQKKLFHFSSPRLHSRIYLTLTRIERENLERKRFSNDPSNDNPSSQAQLLNPCACNGKVVPSSIRTLLKIDRILRFEDSTRLPTEL